MIINLSSYTGTVGKLVAALLLLAVFGASMQCVADCLPQPSAPPCHQHSQKKEPCKHGQFVALMQTAGAQPVSLITHLIQASDPEETSLNLPVRLLTIPRI